MAKKKSKNKIVYTTISTIIWAITMITLGLLTYEIYDFGILPAKYYAIIGVVALFLVLLFVLFIINRKTKKALLILLDIVFSIIIAVCYLVSYIFFLRQDAYADGINRLVLILLVFNCIVMSAGYTLAIVSRLMMYYSVVNILSVPITMSYIKRPIIRYAFCAAILFLLIYQFCGGSNAEYLNGI